MAIRTVGPNSTYPTIAAAMSAAGPGDTIQLELGYSNESATVLHDGMTITGDSSSVGIVLQLGLGIATVTLAGTAPIDLVDASDGNGIAGNDGDNLVTVTAGADAASGGAGNDRLFVDYRLATGAITGTLANVAEAGGGGRLVTINGGFEHFTIWTGSGADTITTGAGDDDIRTGEGAGTITAGEGFNTIVTGSGADTITALGGGNYVDGGDGDNTITTGDGADEILSGAGADTIVTGAGGDRITIAGGADTADAGAGDDLLIIDYAAAVTDVTGGVASGDLAAGYGGHIADLAGATLDFVGVERMWVTTGSGNDNVTTGGGDDIVSGGAGSDMFHLGLGGDDIGFGGSGNDVFLLGPGLTELDKVDGGAGTDQLALQGDYSGGVTLGAEIVSVESLAILPGSDTRFGDPGTNFYDYDVATVDENVAAGAVLVVDANRLRVDEDFTFDGAAETDGSFFIYGGGGTDTLLGGAGNDVFYFGEGLQFGASDRVDGGSGGIDQLALRGSYAIAFGATQLVGIESLGMVSAKDTRYGPLGANYDYDLTMDDGNVAAGVRFTVDAAPLRPTETLTFDGSAELDGSFRVFGGQGQDSITGSSGDDILSGGPGADYLKGGPGADTYLVRNVAESIGTSYDEFDGFDYALDKLDLPGSHDSYAALDGGTLNAASFDADLGNAMSGVLDPSEAVFFAPDAGDLAGKVFLIVDQNGLAGYQPGADFVFDVTASPPPLGPIYPDFIV